jgi:hypothetical protein
MTTIRTRPLTGGRFWAGGRATAWIGITMSAPKRPPMAPDRMKAIP